MFTLLFLAMLALMGFTTSAGTRSQLDRMSLAFGVANKPYEPAPKPKGKTKDKFMHLMARAKYSGVGIVGMSGKVQGTVFLSNNVVRVWRKPNNVRNAFTQLVRGLFSGTSTAWKSLTDSDINSWITSAPLYFSKKVLATSYALKGNTLFQKVNNILTSLGLANVTVAPGIATPNFTITAATAAASVGGATFDVSITEFAGQLLIPTGSYIKVYATRQVDIGKSSFSPSMYKYVAFYPPTTSTNPLAIYADYIARFGALAVGQRIGLAMEVVFAGGSPLLFGQSGKFYLETVVAA